MINHIIDKAFDLAYTCLWFGGAGMIVISVLWLGMKCDVTREYIKDFFNLD